MRENISKSLHSKKTYTQPNDIITSIYQNEAQGKKNYSKKSGKFDYDNLSYDPESELKITSNQFENIQDEEDDYTVNNVYNSFEQESSSNTKNGKPEKSEPVKKKKGKRKKLSITPSMVSAKGMNKIYVNKYEEHKKNYIMREKIMASNRKKKDKLIERMQRYIRKHGRLIYVCLETSHEEPFILKVGSLCNTHHNKHVNRQGSFINKNFVSNRLCKLNIFCKEDLISNNNFYKYKHEHN
jgi:hypothetical protein